jgi:MOSC domain-containing protein
VRFPVTSDPDVSVRLEEIWVYPVKGAAGIRVPEWKVGPLGLVHDRRWMLVDPEGKFRSQRSDPVLCRVVPSFSDGGIRLQAPGMPELTLPLVGEAGAYARVRIWADDIDVRVPSDAGTRWFTELIGAPSTLVFLPESDARSCDPRRAPGSLVGLADAFPFLLTSVESLADLNERLERPVPMNRFRPNLVVAAGEPYAEDGWTDLRVGDVRFRAVKPCARCVVTTVDQATARTSPEPLRTLARYRKGAAGVIFGQNLVHLDQGTIHAGRVIERTGGAPGTDEQGSPDVRGST